MSEQDSEQEAVDNYVNSMCGYHQRRVTHRLLAGYPPILPREREQVQFWFKMGRSVAYGGGNRQCHPFTHMSDLTEQGVLCRDAWLAGWESVADKPRPRCQRKKKTLRKRS